MKVIASLVILASTCSAFSANNKSAKIPTKKPGSKNGALSRRDIFIGAGAATIGEFLRSVLYKSYEHSYLSDMNLFCYAFVLIQQPHSGTLNSLEWLGIKGSLLYAQQSTAYTLIPTMRMDIVLYEQWTNQMQ